MRPPLTLTDKHFSVVEIAELWYLDHRTVRAIFKDEPGVFAICEAKRGVRKYETLRIPQSVAERVYRRMLK